MGIGSSSMLVLERQATRSVVGLARGIRSLAAWLLIGSSGLLGSLSSSLASDTTTYIVRAEAVTQSGRTCLNVVSDGRLAPEIFSVTYPERVVVDASDAAFKLVWLPRALSAGLIKSFRYGPMSGQRARFVIDVTDGARVGRVSSRPLPGKLHLSSISIVSAASSDDQTCMKLSGDRSKMTAWGGKLSVEAGGAAGPKKPVIVIDPGHGGVDPGAVVNRVGLEKSIVLDVAKRVAKRLREVGAFRVVLTREVDTFVSLDERIELTRKEGGDLFISLHADSIDDAALALRRQGAAVYILSHRASDALAKRLADKENAADLPAGILPKKATGSGDVRGILVDLLARETESSSARLRKLLVDAMRLKVRMSRQPLRSAAFHVLKQAETPAVLIELGYMSNPGDLKRMSRSNWKDRMAGAIATAIHNFFKAG